jgi:hypothetical protein
MSIEVARRIELYLMKDEVYQRAFSTPTHLAAE